MQKENFAARIWKKDASFWQHDEAHLLGYLGSTEHNFDGGLPLYQPSTVHGRWMFDIESMEFSAISKKKCLVF